MLCFLVCSQSYILLPFGAVGGCAAQCAGSAGSARDARSPCDNDAPNKKQSKSAWQPKTVQQSKVEAQAWGVAPAGSPAWLAAPARCSALHRARLSARRPLRQRPGQTQARQWQGTHGVAGHTRGVGSTRVAPSRRVLVFSRSCRLRLRRRPRPRLSRGKARKQPHAQAWQQRQPSTGHGSAEHRCLLFSSRRFTSPRGAPIGSRPWRR